jgi:acyl carrier protein
MNAENMERLRAIVTAVLDLPEGADIEGVRRVTSRRWDSLAQVSLVAAIESEFDLVLPVTAYQRMTSVKAIVLLLEEQGL